MLDQQLHNTHDADLFFVVEVTAPSGELVGALNLPRPRPSMPFEEECVKGYT